MKSFLSLFFVLCSLIFSACGPDTGFKKAVFFDSKHEYDSAVKSYKQFLAKYPSDPRVPEALVNSARIYARIFGRCSEAKPLYERAVREFPDREPWASAARQGLLDCPEYFPLRDGTKWLYVDSQTGGKNMSLNLEVSSSSDGARGEIDGAYYAGRKRFQDFHRAYSKQDWAIWEESGKKRVAILKYPFTAGMRWKGRREGHLIEFSIESDNDTVTIRSGTYPHCLKVRESTPGAGAWQYQYYAPGVGRIKTTIGGPGFESPNTELQSVTTP